MDFDIEVDIFIAIMSCAAIGLIYLGILAVNA
jgi:hypothetical protein